MTDTVIVSSIIKFQITKYIYKIYFDIETIEEDVLDTNARKQLS